MNTPDALEITHAGRSLVTNPLLNKGTAFDESERHELELDGLLPPHVETLDDQVVRAYEAFSAHEDDLQKHVYLRGLQDENETLFYRLIHDHLTEMMPIIYTPVVGLACQRFSHIYQRGRGLFASYPLRERIDRMLVNAPLAKVDTIVVTDGERILGLGDQGAGGLGIPIGKLSLYTACAGIDPAGTLPVVLDVGTNNEERLKDPEYIGWRHERVSGQDYYDFVDLFVQGVKQACPGVLLQFEDFAQPHAGPLLERYRDQLCTFNDDIQGTAAVTVGTLLSALHVSGSPLTEQRVVVLGAGSAGCGISEQLVATMMEQGLPEAEARGRFFMVDRPGLLHDGLSGLHPFQERLAQKREALGAWDGGGGESFDFAATVKNARPTILLGLSGQPGMFTEPIIRDMAAHCARPIILPLSNPTSKIEGVPADLIAWTDGRAVVATGSPFDPVSFGGRRIAVPQCNNSYVFPGVALGILGSGASRVTDAMFMAASTTLADASPARQDPNGPILPPLDRIRSLSRRIALAVGREALSAGLATRTTAATLEADVDARMWSPVYRPYVLRK